jgi:hypothetical protein
MVATFLIIVSTKSVNSMLKERFLTIVAEVLTIVAKDKK